MILTEYNIRKIRTLLDTYMDHKGNDFKNLIQTEITSFSKLASQKLLVSEKFKELEKLSLKELQRIARYHKIKSRSKMVKNELIDNIVLFKKSDLTIGEWKNILGNDWKLHGNNHCFIYKDNAMIVGNLSKFDEILKIQNISDNLIQVNEDLNLKNVSKIIERKSSYIVVKFGIYNYDFILIGEAFRILGPDITLLQNNLGTIILKSHLKFIILAPLTI